MQAVGSKNLQELVSEIECRLAQIDIELHEVEYRRESEGQILRIFIDKDSGVDLDTCAKASRAVKSIIDETYLEERKNYDVMNSLKKPEVIVLTECFIKGN